MRVVHPFPQPRRARTDVMFLDPRYPQWRREAGLTPAEHPGVDFNLLGTSGDADLGYPVVAIADGVVVAAGHYPVWGNIVLIEHAELAKALGFPYLATQYAHLLHTTVEAGQRVWAGEPVGSIGKGDKNRFLAHLHFEVRRAPHPPEFWPGTNRRLIEQDYIDPALFLQKHVKPAHVYTFQQALIEGALGRGPVRVVFDSPAVVRIKWLRGDE